MRLSPTISAAAPHWNGSAAGRLTVIERFLKVTTRTINRRGQSAEFTTFQFLSTSQSRIMARLTTELPWASIMPKHPNKHIHEAIRYAESKDARIHAGVDREPERGESGEAI